MNLVDQSLRQIGIAIRGRRAARRMTLGELAERSGLSLSFLSRVERGRAQTSVGNLIRIAEALGVSMHDLIGPPADRADDPGFTVFREASARPSAIPATGYRWTPVSGGGPGRGLEVALLDLTAATAPDVRYAHPGEEICYVLEGTVRFVVGECSTLLAAGDAIHIRSDIPHTAHAAADAPARILMVTHHPSGAGQPDWWTHGAPPPDRKNREDDR